MPTDDRLLPQGKQILTKICQVRPMPDSNKYHTKAFVICGHKSDHTRSATQRKQNVPGLIDVSSAK